MAQRLSCFRPEAITFLEREAHGPSEAWGRSEWSTDWNEAPGPPEALVPPPFPFSDQVKRQSLACSSPVCSWMGGGIGKGKVVSAHSTSITDLTYCVLGPQAAPVYFVPLTQLETSRGLFKKVIQLSSLGGKTWQWEWENLPMGAAGVADWREGVGHETWPAGIA